MDDNTNPPFKMEKVITGYSYKIVDVDALDKVMLETRRDRKLPLEYSDTWKKKFRRKNRGKLINLGIVEKVPQYSEDERPHLYCPICGKWIEASDHLREVFDDVPTRWYANMVTHYRHDHRPSYDRWVGYQAYHGRYREGKHTTNEQAKRQILRKAEEYCREIGLTVDDVATLQGTTDKTLELARKVLG